MRARILDLARDKSHPVFQKMEGEFERKIKTRSAHLFDSKERTEDVKTQEELTFADMHISNQVLKGRLLESYLPLSNEIF